MSIPYDELKLIDFDSVTRAGYFIGNGLYWLGAFLMIGMFCLAIFGRK